MRSTALRRSAISRSRAVKACCSAKIAWVRASSASAIATERSLVLLAMAMAFSISAIS